MQHLVFNLYRERRYMKKLILAAAMASAFAGSVARADDVKPDNETTFNASVVSDYRYRGISQSRLQPAVQGGADYINNPTGLYVGTWLSSIKWTGDVGGSGHVEWDLYAGKRGDITEGLSYDVGVLSYVYPSNDLSHLSGLANANTTELYGQLSAGPAYVKYSNAMTNLFGIADSKHSGYLDFGSNFDAGYGLTVNLHVGHQEVHNAGAASYTDWKAGVTKDFGVASVSLAAVGTNANKIFYSSLENGKFLGKTGLVLNLTKTF
jgi:uncharacterized protein (TIGR02001 family)